MFEGELQPKLVASNRKHKITLLRRIDSKYKDIAKKLMFLEYPDLLAVKNQRESYENKYGKNPTMGNRHKYASKAYGGEALIFQLTGLPFVS